MNKFLDFVVLNTNMRLVYPVKVYKENDPTLKGTY
jgi:hypothetical protein